GFIDRLPLTLIEAFHSTLEETIYADLILLVVDISESTNTVEKKLNVCLETIERIGASGIPIITALNKIDLLREEEINLKLGAIKDKAPNPIPTSALRGTNIELLKEAIVKQLQNYVKMSFTIPLTNETMQFISWLFQRADVQHIEYKGDSANIIFEANPSFAEKVKNQVENFNGKIEKIHQ
ncbi:MAG: GTPase HflX, partial [Candidatus Bathyarchaeia archaeon]